MLCVASALKFVFCGSRVGLFQILCRDAMGDSNVHVSEIQAAMPRVCVTPHASEGRPWVDLRSKGIYCII